MSSEIRLDRRSRYSMQVIREALFELLETKSLDEITVVDIVNEAKVGRGGIDLKYVYMNIIQLI